MGHTWHNNNRGCLFAWLPLDTHSVSFGPGCLLTVVAVAVVAVTAVVRVVR